MEQINKILYVEDGSVDTDLLENILPKNIGIIVYRAGSAIPVMSDLTDDAITSKEETEAVKQELDKVKQELYELKKEIYYNTITTYDIISDEHKFKTTLSKDTMNKISDEMFDVSNYVRPIQEFKSSIGDKK